MATIITAVGGVASVFQILTYFAQTTRYPISFCNSFAEAPKVVSQIKEKLHILQQIIGQVQCCTTELDDGDILPTETKELLLESVNRVHSSLNKAKLKSEVVIGNNIKNKMKRVAWVLRDEPALDKLLHDLEDSNRILYLVMQLVTMKMSIQTLQYQSAAIKTIHSGNKQGKVAKPPVPGAISSNKYITAWLWLRQIGFYGTFKTRSSSECLLDIDVFIGYQFPTWFWSKSVDFQLHLRIPTFIRTQNRVQTDSAFMLACREGDIDLIRQHLEDISGSVGDRLINTGQTSLMLSIESGSINAIKMLLVAGADPNIGDDDGITPIFFALGMDPRRNKPFPQLPPQNLLWMDIIRLLADYNGSVHEVVHGKSLTTLNFVWLKSKTRTLEFFHFLREQCYVDFGAQTNDGWSACSSALRSAESALQCVKFLETVGLDFSRIFTDGRSFLHLGAEFAQDAEVFEYLCHICPPDYINRQDDLGWAPLHYAILFEFLHRPQDSLAKVKALVRRGANPSLKGKRFPILEIIDKDQFTAFELSEALRSDQYERFLAMLKDSGHEIPEDANANIFHETTDSWPVSQ